MSHLHKDIEDLYRKYIEDWIEGVEPVELDSYANRIFYVKNDILILDFDVKTKLFYVDSDFYSFLDNSIGINKVKYIIEDIFKKYFRLEECGIGNEGNADMYFRLVNVHYQLRNNLKEIRILKRQVKNIK
jgi:hypothetical protein